MTLPNSPKNMIRTYILIAITAAGLLLSAPRDALVQTAPETSAKPLPFVSPIFGDNMVLQRGKVNTIWGWANPGSHVRVEIGGKAASGNAGADQRWEVKIEPPPAGGPYTLKIAGGDNTVELHNVLVGDVWLCGGQSNMQVGLRAARNGEEEVRAANYPQIRFFTVASHPSYHPTNIVQGTWKAVDPETAERISVWLITLHGGSSAIFMYRSASSSIALAELRRKHGRALQLLNR
jgi:sialate O-acetylesterase